MKVKTLAIFIASVVPLWKRWVNSKRQMPTLPKRFNSKKVKKPWSIEGFLPDTSLVVGFFVVSELTGVGLLDDRAVFLDGIEAD